MAINSLAHAHSNYLEYLEEVKPFAPVSFDDWLKTESADHCKPDGSPCLCEVCIYADNLRKASR